MLTSASDCVTSIFTACADHSGTPFFLSFRDESRKPLEQFIVDTCKKPCLKNLSTIQELCSCLVAIERNKIYFLIDRLLDLIMTLPGSTSTTERSFSAMKIIKTRAREITRILRMIGNNLREMIFVQPFSDNFLTTFSLILTFSSHIALISPSTSTESVGKSALNQASPRVLVVNGAIEGVNVTQLKRAL
ncbi:hypothetical protein MTR_6g445150 [Medicago truncatula]|uniref:HAT C-terminal dimerisation domain-containing protein n=1 Tax=Medicago truncatula TaxID=3880 RepID=A0A072U8J8_MEDTR|nr:hypothetical protein MTR_6g445150 [Medicago truncatula]